jgi:butyryl-CoA dehydrogenase
MCLSEPHAGSSLSDIATRALPDDQDEEADLLGPRYRLFGTKMWISGGDHEITENIVHLVLAKIPNEDDSLPHGVKGISLFIVPKHLVNEQGHLTGQRNDVALIGLNHKLGGRGTTNTLLNFGEGKYPVQEKAGAIGYLVGKPGEGIKCMFHMMNHARIGVGLGAVALGLAGYETSLQYAKDRPQGRPITLAGKDSQAPQIAIIGHTDVRRMLLAQKAYTEGGLALALFCAKLDDTQHSAVPEEASNARMLLDLLLPIVKSWPSEWCLEANSLAIQVLGGCGYTRDFPVEQHWRDNRLNMIHEGTHGIQALDLLGRKVVMKGGAALQVMAVSLGATAAKARGHVQLKGYADALESQFMRLTQATQAAWSELEPERALANATDYLRAFGHVVIAWMWLDVACTLQAPQPTQRQAEQAQGRLMAARYFFLHELPKVVHWLQLVADRDATCLEMQAEWF